MNAPVRTLASPYARKLARERGIPLALVTGSGPNGRIVAEDLRAAPAAAPEVAAPVVEPVPAPAAVAPVVVAARSISAFAATIDLAPLSSFLVASGSALSIDAFLVKAAARAAGAEAEAIRWIKPEGGAVTIARPLTLAPTEIARQIGSDADAASAEGKVMVVSRLAARGVRPVAGSLPTGIDLRILVVAADGSETAEALVVHGADAIAETEAGDILTCFRDLLEAPLRLLV
ncbi:E3 binding domain-containing protein [Kaistia sp. UC242_56]|uniref:E3 binding domain-containing protein n=1 Tax=Kaistia sp. UC242_56 TaxID=3374625 RepID=UPI0037BCD946